jgi:hypothetical protein
MSLSGMPYGANLASNIYGEGVKGRMQRCTFTAVLRNMSYFVVKANLYKLYGTDTVEEATISWTDALGDPKSVTVNVGSRLFGRTFDIYPGRSITLSYVSVKNDPVRKVITGGYSGTVAFGLSYVSENGSIIGLGNISKTVEV